RSDLMNVGMHRTFTSGLKNNMHNYSSALILGCGRSGRAAERLLTSEGCATRVIFEDKDAQLDCSAVLAENNFEVCIVSPGFGLSHPWIQAVKAAGVPLLSELELGWSRHKGKTIAVTGSNGKSTAVKWICESLQRAEKKASIGGNYGIPACEVVLDFPDLDWLVLEVSSFQLETVQEFRADIAVILNILPNHLDRHETLEIYRKTKARIFEFGCPSDTCIVPENLIGQFKPDINGARNWVTFGDRDADYSFESGQIFHRERALIDLSGTLFDSPVLGRCTGAAVSAVLDVGGINLKYAESAARCFKPLPHRLERLGELGGVTFINDSKATNLAALAVALQACDRGVHLIAGGISKESDYTFIKEILAERVQSIYLIGQASRAMYQAWHEVCLCVECGTLEEAFSTARNTAEAGEIVLLSPGCASFDQFCSFEERGARFTALFNNAVHIVKDAL
ncbi:MAG TPA: UDP-N-acetylmuramoyl-L-alanine--D-glutamate ligase, partial [Pontiella sp.]